METKTEGKILIVGCELKCRGVNKRNVTRKFKNMHSIMENLNIGHNVANKIEIKQTTVHIVPKPL